ncbi:hypothetical protein Cgig2_004710 [Carnegiea gigantea]|uniref:Uncharacterized protein n=1 Tax=Carnegiea gigantea TaxID=171969 RepID=A0A9Q1JU67_9CARY|nr:hypothetical protein Cgig2_004710 [Carnegiea gigantea]
MEAKCKHPLHQIAESPTHKLLLKQWLKEEDLILNRISLKETQIDGVRKELTNLYTLFFLFHTLALLLLFSFSSPKPACRKSWIPCICSFVFSVSIIWAIRYKTDVETHLEKLLEREKEDAKLLGKCVDELKKRGIEFDLLKEVDALRRAKSMRIESKAVRKWSVRDFVSMATLVKGEFCAKIVIVEGKLVIEASDASLIVKLEPVKLHSPKCVGLVITN